MNTTTLDKIQGTISSLKDLGIAVPAELLQRQKEEEDKQNRLLQSQLLNDLQTTLEPLFSGMTIPVDISVHHDPINGLQIIDLSAVSKKEKPLYSSEIYYTMFNGIKIIGASEINLRLSKFVIIYSDAIEVSDISAISGRNSVLAVYDYDFLVKNNYDLLLMNDDGLIERYSNSMIQSLPRGLRRLSQVSTTSFIACTEIVGQSDYIAVYGINRDNNGLYVEIVDCEKQIRSFFSLTKIDKPSCVFRVPSILIPVIEEQQNELDNLVFRIDDKSVNKICLILESYLLNDDKFKRFRSPYYNYK